MKGQEDIIEQLRKLNDNLLKEIKAGKEQTLQIQEQLILLKSCFFGRSSEKGPSLELKRSHDREQAKNPPKERVQLPSLRYSNLPLVERHVELKEIPNCTCCGEKLTDSGMTEDSERLTVIPKKFIVERIKRHKYECQKCHAELVTSPNLPRIKEGSAYGDDLIIDVAVSKYDYLLPVERYVRMAKDFGVANLPTQSLIETTHYLADFLTPLYKELKTEVQAAEVLHADETPHRMLEGDKKSNWFLWGFSNAKASYFELHGTRSGEVASDFLSQACSRYLMSDVFSGYKKATADANVIRHQSHLPLIETLYCNAHARRKFKESSDSFPAESGYFIEKYEEIYHIDGKAKAHSEDEQKKARDEIRLIMEVMKQRALEILIQYPEKSSLGKALGYFIKNFDGLSRFTTHTHLPIDNNIQERQMRNPVIGRKTWYGTHSKRGAQTAAILFSIIESCKLNKLNSNEYIEAQVKNLQQGLPLQTPSKYTAPITVS